MTRLWSSFLGLCLTSLHQIKKNSNFVRLGLTAKNQQLYCQKQLIQRGTGNKNFKLCQIKWQTFRNGWGKPTAVQDHGYHSNSGWVTDQRRIMKILWKGDSYGKPEISFSTLPCCLGNHICIGETQEAGKNWKPKHI